MEEINNPGEDITKNLTEEQLARVQEYQRLHTRLRVLKMQMNDIQEETHDLLETLNKMRIKDNKNESNGEV
jgi:hypothetical protein